MIQTTPAKATPAIPTEITPPDSRAGGGESAADPALASGTGLNDSTPGAEVRPLTEAELVSLRVRTPLAAREVVAKLLALSKRGKLAEFEAGRESGPWLFKVAAFGATFDYELFAYAESSGRGVEGGSIEHGGRGGTTLRFELKRAGRMPLLAAVLLGLSIFPGVLITHSMLAVYFSWYTLSMWQTWLWYIPLTAGPMWPAWRTISRKSREAAEISAREAVEKIVGAVEGVVVTV